MKIVEWNILKGGKSRLEDIKKKLAEQDADIYVIIEYRNNASGEMLTNFFETMGYNKYYIEGIEKNKNSVGIFTKGRFISDTYNELGVDKHREIKISNEIYNIYGLYFAQKYDKKALFEFILNDMNNNKEKINIYIGDFNTGKHFIDEEGKDFKLSEYMDKIEKLGYADTWRYINHDKREYTWYGAKNKFRLDYAFIDEAHKNLIKDCYYIHEVRKQNISDHSMMVLELY